MLPGRFSPLGTLVLSSAGFWWEVETPIYRARLPVPRTQFGSLDGSLAYVDWKARACFKLKTPKIPARLLGQAGAYFAARTQGPRRPGRSPGLADLVGREVGAGHPAPGTVRLPGYEHAGDAW